MWYGQMPPWIQRAGGAAPMTPGAGMPPYGARAPMPMQPRDMRPGGVLPSHPQAATQPRDPRLPVSPAQMGMLAQMLAQGTQGPGGMLPTAGGAPAPGYGPVTEPSIATGAMTGAGGSPLGAGLMDQADPFTGLLRLLPFMQMGGGRMY